MRPASHRTGSYPMGDPRRPIMPVATLEELMARVYVPRRWRDYQAVPADEARRAVRRAVREAAAECRGNPSLFSPDPANGGGFPP